VDHLCGDKGKSRPGRLAVQGQMISKGQGKE
jgi:hypothetical protein